MALRVQLKLTGTAEAFVRRMISAGLPEQDIVARALWLLEQADAGRVGILDRDGRVEYTVSTFEQASIASKREATISSGGIAAAQHTTSAGRAEQADPARPPVADLDW